VRNATAAGLDRLAALRHARAEANERFFAAEAPRIARLCHRLAERFVRGGRLLAFGETSAERTDANHIAVEFVHPVIVGKRALPALALPPGDVALLAAPEDILVAFGPGASITVTLGVDGEAWTFTPPSGDPFVGQELRETLYHLLWELVHIFFEHRGLLEGRPDAPVHDTGASSFLYPFLAEQEVDLDGVLADVRSSVVAKADEIGALREETLGEGAEELLAAAATLRARLDAGGTVLALGNGGSATDAADAVADLRDPPAGTGRPPWPRRRALDLAGDPAILTAIANDIGTEALFARQVIAYGSERDALLALSTSGNSANVVAALAEARRRGLATVAFVGYDGGRVAAEGLADHVVVTRSQHIPRIQEAQAAAWHVLRELIEASP
jgi:D-sedoheptulose 7-phosphate isomerase